MKYSPLQVSSVLLGGTLLGTAVFSSAEAQGDLSSNHGQRSTSATQQPRSVFSWGDYNGDGRADAFVIAPDGSGLLLENLGDGTLRDVTREAGLPGGRARFAIWQDYDLDGRLDLYVGADAGSARLFHNEGSTFADVSLQAGVAHRGADRSGEWLDYDDDGLVDLHVQSGGRSHLYRNLGAGSFERVELELPTAPGLVAGGAPARDENEDRGLAPSEDSSGEARARKRAFDNSGSSALADGRSQVDPSGFRPGTPGPELGGGSPFATNCVPAIEDQAMPGVCVEASSLPTLGKLLPLTSDLFVSPAGNVGVGTTSPVAKLTLKGGERLSLDDNVDDRSIYVGQSEGEPLVITNHSGAVSPTIRFRNDADDSDTMTVNVETGRVGIGTTNPVTELTLKGGARLSLDDNTNDRSIYSPQGEGEPLVLTNATGAGSPTIRFRNDADDSDAMTVNVDNGRVGIGTTSPAHRLHVVGDTGVNVAEFTGSEGAKFRVYNIAGSTTQLLSELIGNGKGPQMRFSGAAGTLIDIGQNASGGFVVEADDTPRLTVAPGGNVGIGAANPGAQLEVVGKNHGGSFEVVDFPGNGTTQTQLVAQFKGNSFAPQVRMQNNAASSFYDFGLRQGAFVVELDDSPKFAISLAGNVGIGTTSPASKLDVKGETRTDVLTITGGADLVEAFDTGAETCAPGTVVVIDSDNPGQLKRSGEAYDKRVAGVVSGAGGVNPGICMGQEGVTDGDTLVAMTGRVYVQCSVENGAIEAGDLLTTSATPGFAMKATDREASHGAVIGKAMSTATENGLVLVLVNLQ